MANTTVQLEVEDWVRQEWLRSKFGEPFFRERVQLGPGGVFDFDAVNSDRSVIATISTSAARTASGKYGVGKMMKIRSDILFLTMVPTATRRLVILTEPCLFQQCRQEQERGRVPASIEFLLADPPAMLQRRLAESRRAASEEVTPSHIARG